MEFPELLTWVDGAPEESPVPAGDLFDPNTGEVLAPNLASSPDQVERAVAAAARAHSDGDWLALGPEGRAGILLAWADRLDGLGQEIARLDALNSGVPISVTALFGSSNSGTVREAVRLLRERGDVYSVSSDDRPVTVRHVPWGPTALIVPWNAPSAMAVKKLAYALAAGAPVVLKPSPASPWSAELVVRAAHEAGVPAGVVNMVLGGGDVGTAVVSDSRVRAISMTGSTPTGRAIAAVAAPRFARLQLELGSNNPVVVRSDADVVEAASVIVSGSLKLSGQWCEAPRRVLVARALLPDLVSALFAEAGRWRVGSSLDAATRVGPVAFEARRTELEGQVREFAAAGARLLRVDDVPDKGWFFGPTIAYGEGLDAAGEMFGPLLSVQPYDTEEQAVALANAGQVGLAAYVMTTDIDAGVALGTRLVAGEVKINGSSVLDMSEGSVQSFFGDGGFGGHGDRDLLGFFSGKQIVGTDRPGLPL
ncbi:aldehyde dehydrogenase family protein [Streptomyces sp. NPDC020766]|uniref:aldehyde dehydrogenase family protein n=1 Tax=Streptomyces sp. NPDC020766 TaxID=3155011 RepID=UPI0033E2D88A